MKWTLAQCHEALAHLPGVQWVADAAARERRVARVHTDTRSLLPGDLFVALKGERFDGADHLEAAFAKGAVAAVASRGLDAQQRPGILVDDALLALQELSLTWRMRHDLPLIAVTGSNGKTTVTQMIGSILRAAWGERAWVTAGNLNNHIGVPLTLLGLRDTHAVAVVEMGMNHPGEVALLARLAAPTVAVVNNAQREHQEFMPGVEAVAMENGAVIAALPADGVAVFPADDPHAGLWRRMSGARRVCTFALSDNAAEPADVRVLRQWVGSRWRVTLSLPSGNVTCWLHAPGEHNVHNALAAAAACSVAGIDAPTIGRGLEQFTPVAGRSHAQPWPGIGQSHGRAGVLIDDSYNANPDSVRAAIDLLAGLNGPRWLILGDMGEVGDHGPAFHAEVGAYARERQIDALWCAGSACRHSARAFGERSRVFADAQSLVAAIAEAPAAANVLVKGSRFMGMERVVRALEQLNEGNTCS